MPDKLLSEVVRSVLRETHTVSDHCSIQRLAEAISFCARWDVFLLATDIISCIFIYAYHDKSHYIFEHDRVLSLLPVTAL